MAQAKKMGSEALIVPCFCNCQSRTTAVQSFDGGQGHSGSPAGLTEVRNGREPSTAAAAAVAAAANPSAGTIGLASTGAPPSTSLARGLFMPPRMTSAAGIVAPAPAPAVMKPFAPPSKLPNAARPKKGKTSEEKNKEAGGSSTLKALRKKVAGHVRGEASTKAPASSLVELAADAHNAFDDMPQSVNDDAYMSTMGVGSNNSHWSQTNDMHFEDHEFEVDEDVKYCTKLVQGRGKEDQEGEDKERKAIYLAHCYEVLKDDEK
ncbi:putative receptor protein kinase ZmPK1 [Hordeum vulgare]|nr:putative receptor protein kinase ZmPK1 [Hordeum vulgare]